MTDTQTKTKHTPGEWKIFESASRYIIENEEGTGFVDVWIIGNVTKEEALANAKLIAAAQDLLNALRGFIVGMDKTNDKFPGHSEAYLQQVVLPKAQAAIEKATLIET